MTPVFQALRSRHIFSLLSVGVLFGLVALTPASHARTAPPLLATGVVPAASTDLPLTGKRYELRMYALHTGESLDVVYRIGNTYIPSALDELNHFLRDHTTQAVSHYDPREFDLLHNLLAKLGRPHGLIDVVCGYRTPWTNNNLRTAGGTETPAETGVAEYSEHMQAKAIDIRVPGVSTRRLDRAALSLHEGGVGYYPVSQFVHVDVGPVRQWSFGARHARRRRYVHRRG
ncbi:MAG TPA: DUF882 domain-containing protein [Acidobacteriaceae bacterium]|jgi:uncharacterized protein YcbK (DUF882 family)|nr:DUF882 domain-containing protein [Acidobacteriaceae bacterium]